MPEVDAALDALELLSTRTKEKDTIQAVGAVSSLVQLLKKYLDKDW
jgi:hypothetical protein